MEVKELSWRKSNPLPTKGNGVAIREVIEILEEKRMTIAFIIAVIKQTTASSYNHQIQPREF